MTLALLWLCAQHGYKQYLTYWIQCLYSRSIVLYSFKFQGTQVLQEDPAKHSTRVWKLSTEQKTVSSKMQPCRDKWTGFTSRTELNAAFTPPNLSAGFWYENCDSAPRTCILAASRRCKAPSALSAASYCGNTAIALSSSPDLSQRFKLLRLTVRSLLRWNKHKKPVLFYAALGFCLLFLHLDNCQRLKHFLKLNCGWDTGLIIL